jgi:probable biosynthetic protein (TIGR04098 family)
VLGRPGEVTDRVEDWRELALPQVSWSSAWTVTRANGDHELSMAVGDVVAELPRLAKVPAGVAAARDAFARGRLWAPSRGEHPVRYPVLAGRDAAVGRQMMFSQFVVLLDVIERAFLGERIAFPTAALDAMSVTERRVFYFGNCGAGDVVEAYVTAKLMGAAVRTEIELVDAATRRLLALADTEKTLAISHEEAERMLARYGEGVLLAEVRP